MKKINVSKVVDGDTFKDSRGSSYRLAEVYAPEKGEYGGKKATDTLQKMVEGRAVYVKQVGTSYNRKVVDARVQGEKMSVNEKMRRRGYK